MDVLVTLGRTLGFSLTSGVNLYATVAILGLAARFDWFALPPQYDVFASDWVIGLALSLYAVEFVADKIPWVDSLWDSVHTIIRPIGGALVAVGTLEDASPSFELLVGLLGGGIAAGSHLTKASTRVVANASPEPFTNWALSFAGDAFVLGLGLLALKYPIAAFVVAIVLIAGIVFMLRWVFRKLRGASRSASGLASTSYGLVLLALLATPPLLVAQQPDLPRFRGGATLVRVDAFVTDNGVVVKDLTADDFEVLEDNVPQRVESFRLVQPRGPGPANAVREPNTVAESIEITREADARVFVLFLDIWNVQLQGSYRAQAPLTRLLNRVIGQDDLVGVLTPDMAARGLTLARRTESIEGILKNHWYWGERDQLITPDPREQEFRDCYPDKSYPGVASGLIARRREGRTLAALENLIIHLEGLREERKFVLVLTEGWLLPGLDPDLAVRLPNRDIPGGATPIGTDPNGRLRIDPNRSGGSTEACERERSLLAHSDLGTEFQQLLMRANRANVSFYPIDARGLVPFDEPIGPDAPPGPIADAERLGLRRESVRTLALNTDGYAIVDTNAIDKALDRMVADTGAYYLLGYYSTNTKLDGRFRTLTVRVKRPQLEVRARPGYQAPTEAEMASARVERLMNGAAPGHTTIPPSIARAFKELAPTRGAVPLRLHAAAAPGHIWVTAELDPATLRAVEWQQGGRARVAFEHDRGEGPSLASDVTLEPGQSAVHFAAPAGAPIAAGRYVLRLHLTAKAGGTPLQATTDVVVPDAAALLSSNAVAFRRGPATGLAYRATADARFRRTERLRLEVARAGQEGAVSARLLGRDGQPLSVSVPLSERIDSSSTQRLVVADLTLAPLAQGDYVIEVTLERGDVKESAAYAFRVVP